jgi:hypothetical protein
MTKILDTYDPSSQERFASLSQLFRIRWALHAPREQLDGLVRRQQDAFEASFKTLAAFDAFMKGKAIEHGLCIAEAWPTHVEGAHIADVKQTYADLVEADDRRKAVVEIGDRAIRFGLCTAETWPLSNDATISEASAVVRHLMQSRH